MFAIGAYIKIADPAKNVTTSLPAGGKAAMFFFYLWTAFYAVSWNGTPWVVNSEAFPGAVRQVTQCLAASSNWLCTSFSSFFLSLTRKLTFLSLTGNFVISRATPTMFLNMGYGVYFFFAAMQVLSIPYIVMLLPETRHIPLEEMDRLFAQKNVWNANKIVMAELKREHEIGNRGDGPSYLKPTASQEQIENSSQEYKA
jgi:hypothetical protein